MSNLFPFSDPVAVTRDTTNSIGVEMIDLRRGLGALSQPQSGNTFGTTSGVFPGGTTGAGFHNDLAFTGASGLTLNFNAGHYACDRGTGNLYLGMAYAGWSITLDTGDAVNPRIDMVVIRNRDPRGLDSSLTGITQSAWPVILKGSPAASPAKPTGQLTNGDVPLWSFTVGGGSNANSIIANQDERMAVAARGGIYPKPSWDTRTGAYEGAYRDNLTSKALERWNGTGWDAVASPAVWSQFTPQLFSTGGGACSLGSGGTAAGYYIVTGKIMHLRYVFYGQSGANMGFGQIYTNLPSGVIAARFGEQHIYCKINTPIPQTMIFMGECFIPENQTRMYPYFPLNGGDVRIAFYKVADQAGQPDKSVPWVPGGYADPQILIIQGTIEIQ